MSIQAVYCTYEKESTFPLLILLSSGFLSHTYPGKKEERMSIDPLIVGQSVMTSLATDAVKGELGPKEKTYTEKLLECILHELQTFTSTANAPAKHDLYRVETLYKAGPYWKPPLYDRQFISIFSANSFPLLVVAGVLGTFAITVPGGTWYTLEFPDNTDYQLDASDTVSQRTVFARYSEVKP